MTMLQLQNASKMGTTSTPESKENDVSFQVVFSIPPPCYYLFFLICHFNPNSSGYRVYSVLHLFHPHMHSQAMNEDGGTPSHTTTAVIHRKKTDAAPRSLGRELLAVTRQIQTIKNWRDEVEQHMSQNKDDMAAVNKKLDLLLEVMLPTAGVGGASTRRANVAPNTVTCSPPGTNASNMSAEKTTCNPTVPAENERTCSASGVSSEVCAGLPESSLPGTR